MQRGADFVRSRVFFLLCGHNVYHSGSIKHTARTTRAIKNARRISSCLHFKESRRIFEIALGKNLVTRSLVEDNVVTWRS
jgi:hypothetical protein